ncbi:hypothetical protein PPL_08313 [Heterostelium album PN500]|uniref:Mis18 domain-containing protein n=1 Tax=Heterostelium pallidum (strain ATCC 26659 / Pp 5 / PN500) TaxID=670386 RepID=D3BHU8_HETP5|nr:hypothetical protein PPL_08313 [Heterostelium album PN500]EFA78848.1 hypothetical protein PPL_08313 [Heterostelium album PN500]|eukprot:XP_020430972.1 hypothetical protein PPL_08313 [Heterostelium album PN500]
MESNNDESIKLAKDSSSDSSSTSTPTVTLSPSSMSSTSFVLASTTSFSVGSLSPSSTNSSKSTITTTTTTINNSDDNSSGSSVTVDKFKVNDDNELIIDIGPQAVFSLLKEQLSPMPLSPRSPRISPTLSSASHRSPPKKHNLLSLHQLEQQQQQQQNQHHHTTPEKETCSLLFKEPLPHSPRRSSSPRRSNSPLPPSEIPFIGLSPLKPSSSPSSSTSTANTTPTKSLLTPSTKLLTPTHNRKTPSKFGQQDSDEDTDTTVSVGTPMSSTSSISTPTSDFKSGVFSTPCSANSPFKLPNGSARSTSSHRSYPSTPTSSSKQQQHHHHQQRLNVMGSGNTTPIMPTPIRKQATTPPTSASRATPNNLSTKKRRQQAAAAAIAQNNTLNLQDYFNSILVFCCVGCNIVVGDSTMLVSETTDEQEQFMINQKCYLMTRVAHSIVESDASETEEQEQQEAAAAADHTILSCPICSNEIGYKLNAITENEQSYYILNSDSISYYQLGAGRESNNSQHSNSIPPLPVENTYISNLHGSISFLSDRVSNLEGSIKELLDIFSDVMDEKESLISSVIGNQSMYTSTASSTSAKKQKLDGDN